MSAFVISKYLSGSLK